MAHNRRVNLGARSRLFGLFLALVLVAACAETRYLLQATPGQAELFTRARDSKDVIADSQTDPRTREMLLEVERIRQFAQEAGLEPKGNYKKFVELDRSAVVYFLAGSKPLSFEPKLWSFPIVGSFPYTGWFDYWEARRTRERLERDGWDVFIRPVRAYSTGGWLRDPLLSTMLTGGDDAIRYLVNVVLHELVHSNFFVPDQATFNESLASFVGDQLADDYLVTHFGAESEQVTAYRDELLESEARVAVLGKAYAELEALYASEKTDKQKLARKREVLTALRRDADLTFEPNNASLVGFKTYNSGLAELRALFARCSRDWQRFFAIIKTVKRESFSESQLEAIGPFIDKLGSAGCSRKSN